MSLKISTIFTIISLIYAEETFLSQHGNELITTERDFNEVLVKFRQAVNNSTAEFNAFLSDIPQVVAAVSADILEKTEALKQKGGKYPECVQVNSPNFNTVIVNGEENAKKCVTSSPSYLDQNRSNFDTEAIASKFSQKLNTYRVIIDKCETESDSNCQKLKDVITEQDGLTTNFDYVKQKLTEAVVELNGQVKTADHCTENQRELALSEITKVFENIEQCTQ